MALVPGTTIDAFNRSYVLTNVDDDVNVIREWRLVNLPIIRDQTKSLIGIKPIYVNDDGNTGLPNISFDMSALATIESNKTTKTFSELLNEANRLDRRLTSNLPGNVIISGEAPVVSTEGTDRFV